MTAATDAYEGRIGRNPGELTDAWIASVASKRDSAHWIRLRPRRGNRPAYAAPAHEKTRKPGKLGAITSAIRATKSTVTSW
jgi:hypothetical protein